MANGSTAQGTTDAKDLELLDKLAKARALGADETINYATHDFAAEVRRLTDKKGVEIFFSLYFVMTGIHAAHMVIGIVMMAIILRMAAKGAFTPEYFAPVEVAGLYWHFVDIVWIFLFPLLYIAT